MAEAELSGAQNDTYHELIAIGFDTSQSTEAAKIFGTNLQDAINYLLDNTVPLPTQTATTSANAPAKIKEDDKIHVIPRFRINRISRMLVNGFFHDSLTNHPIVPSVIQNLMLQYANMLFVKLQYHIDDEHKDEKLDENDLHYMAFQKDICLGEIMLLVEKNNDYNYDHEEKEKDSECGYPQFVHLWLQSKIYIFDGTDIDVNSGRKWYELPADSEDKKLNFFDSKIEDETCLQIAVEKYDKVPKQWPFQSYCNSSEIVAGDIIDAYCSTYNKWFESVVKSIEISKFMKCKDQAECNVHYIGLSAGNDAVLPLNSKSDVDKRGTHTNGPDRRNWWRRSMFVGYKLDIYDIVYNKWYTGQIVELFVNGKIKVHYDGYSSNYDEYHDRESERMELLGTHTDHKVTSPRWRLVHSKN